MRRYWLCYDLGLRGDYEGLYEWLDRIGAKECSEAAATFVTAKTREQIKKELAKILSESPARIYLIAKRSDGKTMGGFILGKRKRPPWSGYAESSVDSGEEEA